MENISKEQFKEYQLWNGLSPVSGMSRQTTIENNNYKNKYLNPFIIKGNYPIPFPVCIIIYDVSLLNSLNKFPK